MPQGQLRVYLGAAPGVGRTYKMLDEGHRRVQRGADLVAGYVESHGRPHTQALLPSIELVPRRSIIHRRVEFTEMDLDATLAPAPRVVLIDELAHTEVAGSRKRQTLAGRAPTTAAITVIITVNIHHPESINEVVAQVTGIQQDETVPDAAVRPADHGDRDNTTGVGLGLALSRGLAEAMGGTLTPDTTPGGGLTMTLRVPETTPAHATAE